MSTSVKALNKKYDVELEPLVKRAEGGVVTDGSVQYWVCLTDSDGCYLEFPTGTTDLKEARKERARILKQGFGF